MYWGQEQCKFCVVGYIDTDSKKDPSEVAEVVACGVEEGSIKTHVALTSGALPRDEALKLLGETSKAIKDLVDLPVSVNAEPPRKVENIEMLSSADTVYFNLEIYDRTKRKEIMPGKSEYTPEYYDRVFEECKEYFDENQIGSVLLAGLEDESTHIEGIEHLAKQGVIPVPIPLYPTFHTKIEKTHPPSEAKMKGIYLKTKETLDEHGLDPFKTKAGFMRGGSIFALKEICRDI